jgi:uncharacterized protein (DUF305 family)
MSPHRNVDRDFVNMMIPHHQGAIDMAVAEPSVPKGGARLRK